MGPGPAKAFGKPNHADGHGGDIGQFEKAVGFLVEPHDLGASPANIKNDDMIGMIFKQRPASDGCQFGFGRPVNNFEAQARFFAHSFDEIFAIFGIAACFGGNTTHTRDASFANFAGTYRQC